MDIRRIILLLSVDGVNQVHQDYEMTKIILLLSFVFLSLSFSNLKDQDIKKELFKEVSAKHITFSYHDARVKLFNKIHLEKDSQGYYIQDVYCAEKFYPFAGQNPGERLPNPVNLNTEHTWPQSKFTNRFNEETQKTDLHHLYPTISKINSERGNLPFAEVTNEDDLYCSDSRRGASLKTGHGTYFEPRDEHKGNIARAMFYFSIRYQIEIDPDQEFYLRRWHDEDPVDANEKTRNEMIYSLQKNRNPFIDRPELVHTLSDF